MDRGIRPHWIVVLLLATVLVAVPAAQQPVDLAGSWQSNVGLTYTITQSGTQCAWQDSSGVKGTVTFTPTGLSTAWTDATGPHSAAGTISERDPAGRPTRITWSNGVVFMRAPAASPMPTSQPAPAKPGSPAPPQPGSSSAVSKAIGAVAGVLQTLPGGTRVADLAGTWSSNGGLSYTITHAGEEFQWQDSTGVRGTGRVTVAGLTTTWTDATGAHSAAGAIVERDAAGRATRITWSNGVVFMRASAAAGPSVPPVVAPAGPAPAAPAAPAPAAPAPAATPAQSNLEGTWSSNIGESYAIRQSGADIRWRARSGVQGTIAFIPNGLMTKWSDTTGEHSATGTITERDVAGRPTKIVWSHGVVFERQVAGTPPGAPPALMVPGAVATPPLATPGAPGVTGPGQPPSPGTSTSMVTGMVAGTVILPAFPTVMGLEVGVNRPGADATSFDMDEPRPDLCREACEKQSNCRAFTFVRAGVFGSKARCWLKTAVPVGAPDPCCLSGVMPPPPVAVAAGGSAKPSFTAGAGNPPIAKGPRRSPIDPVAQQRLARLQQSARTWAAEIPAAFGKANQELVALQRARFAQQVAGLRQVASEPQLLARLMGDPTALALKLTGPTQLANQGQTEQLQIGGTAVISSGQLSHRPEVHQVLSVHGSARPATIDEGALFFVTGRGLGKTPGIVQLQYSDRAQEFAPAASHTIDLLPGGDSWKNSWSETAVAVRLPFLPQREVASRAVLRISVAGSAEPPIEHQVELVFRQLGIGWMAVAPMWADLEHPHVLVPRGHVVLAGSVFGTVPGGVTLELTEPIAPFGGATLTQIPLTLTLWRDDRIEFDIPDVQGSYPFQGARLRVRNTLGQEAMQGVRFGPRMEFRVLSGFEFMEFAQEDENDTAEAVNGVLRVVHDPGCGNVGNEGNDWFFSARPLPANTRVARFAFASPNPDEPSLAEQLFDELLDWAKKGIYVKILEAWGLFIASIFDSNIGSYKVDATTLALPGLPDRLQVHWENTCLGPYDGLPIIYTLSFVVWTPEGTFPAT